MPNLGVAEIVAILVVALVVLGPKRLPEVGRKIGGFVRELRTHSESVKAELRDVIDIDGVTESVNSVRRDLKEATSFGSVFTDAEPAEPRTRPTAPPLAGGDAGVAAPGIAAADTNPMMRALGRGAVTPGSPTSAVPPGPTRRLPGAAAPAGDPGGNGNGSVRAEGDGNGAVTRRIPGAGDEA